MNKKPDPMWTEIVIEEKGITVKLSYNKFTETWFVFIRADERMWPPMVRGTLDCAIKAFIKHNPSNIEETVRDMVLNCINNANQTGLYYTWRSSQLQQTKFTPETVFVLATSHRAGDKIADILGTKLHWYTDMGIENGKYGGKYIRVTLDDYEKIKDITGVRKPRIQEGYTTCWNGD